MFNVWFCFKLPTTTVARAKPIRTFCFCVKEKNWWKKTPANNICTKWTHRCYNWVLVGVNIWTQPYAKKVEIIYGRASDWESVGENKQRECRRASLNLNLYFGIRIILVGFNFSFALSTLTIYGRKRFYIFPVLFYIH